MTAMREALDTQLGLRADIYAYDDGIPYQGLVWPTDAGVATILCHDCGEIANDGKPFSNFGPVGGPRESGRCNVCKGIGTLLVGM